MNVTDTSRTGNTKVFLSYAQEDKETARYIADAETLRGIYVV